MTLKNFGPGVALLIDCWAHYTDPLYVSTWNNIVNAIDQNNIETAVLSTYEYDIETHWPSSWFKNTHRIFFHGKANTDQWIRCLPVGIGTAPGYIFQTAPEILNMQTKAQQLMMHSQEILKYYLEHIVPHVKTVWYFGAAWNKCLAHRPIGHDNMATWFANKGIDVLTDANCVIETHNGNCKHPSRFDDWEQVIDNVYKLKVK